MKRIIVGMDGSDHAKIALEWAVDEGARRSWPVTALFAYQRHNLDDGGLDRPLEEADARVLVDSLVTDAIGSDQASHIDRVVRCGLAGPSLVEATADACLLVVGARGLGELRELLVGSVSQYALHHPRCPVAIVRSVTARTGAPRHVVVGVDGSENAAAALAWAVEEAASDQAQLDIAHTWSFPYASSFPMAPAMDLGVFEQAARRDPRRRDRSRARRVAPPGAEDRRQQHSRVGAPAGSEGRGPPRRRFARSRRLHGVAPGIREPPARAPRNVPPRHRSTARPVVTPPELEELSYEECLALLRSAEYGRIALIRNDAPLVLPVNHRLAETSGRTWIAFRTRPGNVIEEAGIQVAFEIDGIDQRRREGWSVLVRGTLHHVDPDQADFRERFDPEPWLTTDRDAWLIIEPFHITGRRLVAVPPRWPFHVAAYL